jgi:phosphoribosylformylglycinamidine synthase
VDDSLLFYIPFTSSGFSLGGSSFAQVLNQLGNNVPDIPDAGYMIQAFGFVQDLIHTGEVLAGHDVAAGGLFTTLLEMTFPAIGIGMAIDLEALTRPRQGEGPRQGALARILFSERPGVVIQVRAGTDIGLSEAVCIGKVTRNRSLTITSGEEFIPLDIDTLRDTWFKTSYLLDRKQSGEDLALERFRNYRNQPLRFEFPDHFTGKPHQYQVNPRRRHPSGIKAAIIREKGVNRDRDMAWALYLAGFDVKDIHMTDLISGRENLEDVNMIAFVGGFSNSDVLGSAKGWAGAFLYNEKARAALDRFYQRDDTLSLGVCNGCQLMVELGLIYPGNPLHPYMSWNDSHKYECTFVAVDIVENHSVMLNSLAGSRLGIWVAHGEGKFNFPGPENGYHIPAKFSYHDYPGNPNGSMYDAACVASEDGRHLAIMPHLEDSVLPWQWAWYPDEYASDEITPWLEAFVNARNWIMEKTNSKK